MSSYFDEKSRRISHSLVGISDDAACLQLIAQVEREVISDVQSIICDHQFPADLRDKARQLIGYWRVGANKEATSYVLCLRMSELVERLHTLFHEVASRRIRTRFGLLDDNPQSIITRQMEHDAA